MKETHPKNVDLIALEDLLRARFQAIKPDQQFVGILHTKLENSPILQKQRKVAYVLMTTAGGLLLGLIIFLIGKGFLQESRST